MTINAGLIFTLIGRGKIEFSDSPFELIPVDKPELSLKGGFITELYARV